MASAQIARLVVICARPEETLKETWLFPFAQAFIGLGLIG